MAEHHAVPLDDGPLPLRALINAIDPRVPEAEGGPTTRPEQHYEECPQYDDPTAPNCHCEGINQAEENYRTEPPGFLG
jgi:hypothetical protein